MSITLSIAWNETRLRFLIGLCVMLALASSVVFLESTTVAMFSKGIVAGLSSEQIGQVRAALSNHTTYIQSQWFGKNLFQFLTLFALILGIWNTISRKNSQETRLLLGLPIPRRNWLLAKVSISSLELFLLAVSPSILIPLSNLWTGRIYGWGSTFAHSACSFAGALPLLVLAVVLSLLIRRRFISLMVALAGTIVIFLATQAPGLANSIGLVSLMTGDALPRIPVAGLLFSFGLAFIGIYYGCRKTESIEI